MQLVNKFLYTFLVFEIFSTYSFLHEIFLTQKFSYSIVSYFTLNNVRYLLAREILADKRNKRDSELLSRRPIPKIIENK